MPKFRLIYFKNLLDIALIKFFDEYNDKFQNSNGIYIFSENWNTKKFATVLKKYIIEILQKHIVKYDRLKPIYYLIIGACMPKDNMLLQYKDLKYFPQKLDKIIQSDLQLKYLLREKDIKIDSILLNNACVMLFNEFFCMKEVKHKNEIFKNLIFVQHKNLDCYTTFKLIKYSFGRSNCINMYKELFKEARSPIIAINDLIDKYINKSCMNSSDQIKLAGKELVQFINERIAKI